MRRERRLPKDDGPPVVEPAAMGPDARRRLSGPGLRTFRAIADRWGMTEPERLMALGRPSRSTYYQWLRRAEAGEPVTLSLDTLLRISAILGIHKALTIVLPREEEASAWLRGPHRGLPFAGQAPIDLIASGTQDGPLTVRRYLDAWRGGRFAPSFPGEDVEPVTGSDLVFG